MAWYSTGSVSLTNGSSVVIGNGTQFITNTKSGDIFICIDDGVIYEIDQILAATQLTLKRPFGGTTNATAQYEIVPTTSYLKTLAQQVADLITLYQSVPQSTADAQAAAVQAQGYRDTAVTAATNAQAAATTTETWKTAAATSATNAKTSETNASNSASAAAASATNLSTAVTNAATSATNAKTSETNAKTSETNAKGSESTVVASKNAAATSETNAKTSETNAAASASAAATSKTASDTNATNAGNSASAALASKNAAATSETNAKTSETNAKTSETNAKTSETNAANSASSAASAVANAVTLTTAQTISGGKTFGVAPAYSSAAVARGAFKNAAAGKALVVATVGRVDFSTSALTLGGWVAAVDLSASMSGGNTFTAPVAGVYKVRCVVHIGSGPAIGNFVDLYLYVAGNPAKRTRTPVPNPAGTIFPCVLETVVTLAAGAAIGMVITGSAAMYTIADTSFNELDIELQA